MLIDTVKELIVHQFEAGLTTLAHAIHACPERLWNEPVARYPFCQTAFHTLFFTDVYLCLSPDGLHGQPFHLAHPDFFGDYEQTEDREPTALYSRAMIRIYLDFCRTKANDVLTAETAEDLTAPARFPRKSFSRAELHLYNIRHIQHHAAQLILKLRLDSAVDVPWIGSGWREPTHSS
jgi:hypothetical protein